MKSALPSRICSSKGQMGEKVNVFEPPHFFRATLLLLPPLFSLRAMGGSLDKHMHFYPIEYTTVPPPSKWTHLLLSSDAQINPPNTGILPRASNRRRALLFIVVAAIMIHPHALDSEIRVQQTLTA